MNDRFRSNRNPGGRGAPSKRPRFRAWRKLAGASLAVSLLVVGTGAVVIWSEYRSISSDLPTVSGLRTYQPPVMSRIYDTDGRVIAELAAERRIFVPYAAIPAKVKNAFISAEDQNFYTHGGIDPLAILRASVTDLENIHSGRRPIGASTITQQVAKIMLLDGETMTFKRKIKEALLAMRMEQTLSKDRILDIYLNEIYLGAGAYGVAAAAQTYFGKPLDQLDDAEAAFLGALPKSPTNYNPYRFPAAARARRDWVLSRMADTGSITLAASQAAMAEPLIPQVFHRPGPAPGSEWFSSEVRRELIARYGKDQSTQGGLVVQTSLDPKLQAEATRDLRAGLMRYDHQHGGWRGPLAHLDGLAPHRRARAAPVVQAVDWPGQLAKLSPSAGALPDWRLGVILSTATGKVGWLEPGADGTGGAGAARVGVLASADLAWMRQRRAPHIGDVIEVEPDAGGPADKGADTLARLRLRQAPKVEGALVAMDPRSGRVLAMVGGWSFQESQFNRATQALRQPGSSFKPLVYLAAMEQGISPADTFLDAPYVNGKWRPNNYELDFGGPTTLHDALRRSLNLVTIRLAAHIGMGSVAKVAIALHEYDSMPKVLPAALGAVDTTVLREAGAYASIEEGGHEVLPSLIDTVQDREGQVVWRPRGLTAQPSASAPSLPPVIEDQRAQVTDPDSAYQVVQMMRDVIARGTGKPAGFGIDRPLAGKTGTTQDFNDAWFAGFSPELLTVVWVGFDEPHSLGEKETGAAIAAPIWNQFMKTALAGRPVVDFRVPDDMTLMRYSTGEEMAVDAFKPGQAPGSSSLVAANDGHELGPQDTGAENVPDAETQMASDGAVSTTSVDAGGPGVASPANAAEPGANPPGAPPGALPGAPAPAGPPSTHPAGGDIGMGGLY